MKYTIKVEKEIYIKYIEVTLPIYYEKEDMPYDFPMRNGGVWAAIVDIDSGKIERWPQGREGSFYMKVCDSGTYELLDPNFKSIVEIQDYVPNSLIPGEWGDYVDLKIDKEGYITNWPKNPSVSEFFRENE